MTTADERDPSLTAISYGKAQKKARRKFLEDCVGVVFQDAIGERIRLHGLTSDQALLCDAVTLEPTVGVQSDRWENLIRQIRDSARSTDSRTGTLLFIVPGEGERIVVNWPRVVYASGRTVDELLREGVAHSLLNPRKSSEAWN